MQQHPTVHPPHVPTVVALLYGSAYLRYCSEALSFIIAVMHGMVVDYSLEHGPRVMSLNRSA